jgi:hypothetical protein
MARCSMVQLYPIWAALAPVPPMLYTPVPVIKRLAGSFVSATDSSWLR